MQRIKNEQLELVIRKAIDNSRSNIAAEAFGVPLDAISLHRQYVTHDVLRAVVEFLDAN